MKAYIFVLDHDAPCRQLRGYIKILGFVIGGRHQPVPQVIFHTIVGKGDGRGRTNIHARIAFNTEIGGKNGLNIAVQASLGFTKGGIPVEAKFNFRLQAF
jgi:hypothetical protein